MGRSSRCSAFQKLEVRFCHTEHNVASNDGCTPSARRFMCGPRRVAQWHYYCLLGVARGVRELRFACRDEKTIGNRVSVARAAVMNAQPSSERPPRTCSPPAPGSRIVQCRVGCLDVKLQKSPLLCADLAIRARSWNHTHLGRIGEADAICGRRANADLAFAAAPTACMFKAAPAPLIWRHGDTTSGALDGRSER